LTRTSSFVIPLVAEIFIIDELAPVGFEPQARSSAFEARLKQLVTSCIVGRFGRRRSN
jgi:hypothetical protein